MTGPVTLHGPPQDSQAMALAAARAALEKHAEAVTIIDLRSLSTVTDFFVICTAESGRQIDALRRHVEAALAQQGLTLWHAEGTVSPRAGREEPPLQWVLLDCGDVVVHLFDERARAFYRLEDLWADAPRVPLPPA